MHLQSTKFFVVLCKATRKPEILNECAVVLEKRMNMQIVLWESFKVLYRTPMVLPGCCLMIVETVREELEKASTGNLRFLGIKVLAQYGNI